MRRETGGLCNFGVATCGALLDLVQESKILASCFKEMSWLSPRVANGADGAGLARAWTNSVAVRVAASAGNIDDMVRSWGGNWRVRTTLSDRVDGM